MLTQYIFYAIILVHKNYMEDNFVKKIIFIATILLCLAMPITAFAAVTPTSMPNQKEYTVRATTVPPIIDGVISEGEYGTPIAVYNYGDGLTRDGDIATPAEMKDLVASDWTMYFTYDNDYLYFACTYIDDDFDSVANTAGYGIWNGDSLEVDFWKYTNDWNEYKPTDKVRYILGLAKDGSYWGGWAAVASYTTGDAATREEMVGGKERYAVSQNETLFTYEVKFTWQEAAGSDVPVDDLFFYAQLATDSVDYDSLGAGAVFWWRNVIPFSEAELAEAKAVAGENALSYETPILHFSKETIPVVETEPPATEAPADTALPDDDKSTPDNAEAVDDLTPPDENEYGDTPDAEIKETDAPAKTGCGASGGALVMLVSSLACAFAITNKKKQ